MSAESLFEELDLGPVGQPAGAVGEGTRELPEPRFSAVRIAEMLGRPRPTDEQVAVIEAPLAPLLVVAGAGSGKTETMAARVVWLIANEWVAKEAVLGLTFTRKAAGELAERVQSRLLQLDRALGNDGAALSMLDRPAISTYNSYAASLVGDHALRIGIEPGARLLSEASQWQLAAEVVESWAGDLQTDAAFSTVVGAVLSLSGALSEHLLSPDEARAGIAGIVDSILATPLGGKRTEHYAEVKRLLGSLGERHRLLDVVETYQERKRTSDSLDFGDQVAIAARLARDVPAVGAGERARYGVVLLDEYQDTSYAQVELLCALFGGHPVTAVGDPNQSIYGWRGASASGLARFPERFRTTGPGSTGAPADVRYLSTSWRNDRAVLAAANVTAAPLREGATRVPVPQLDERPGAGRGVVTGVYAATLEEEAAAVADFVAERWRPRTRRQERVTAAVLCRARSQFLAMEVALRAKGLPVEVVGLGGLLSTPEVVDLVALLEVAHDPSRGDSLMRILTGPRLNLGAADLHALSSWAADLARRDAARRPSADSSPAGPSGGEGAVELPGVAEDGTLTVVEGDVVDHRSIVDALDDLPAPGRAARDGRELTEEGHARLAALAKVLRDLRGQTYLSLPELVTQAERALGLDIEVTTAATLAAGGFGEEVGDRGRAHLDAFRDVAATFSQSADLPTLGAFLAWLGTAGSQERGLDLPVREPDPDAVQIITVHASKGLEWDVVAVPGMVDGIFPNTAVGDKGPTDSGWFTGLGNLPYPLRGDAEDLPVFHHEVAEDAKDLDGRRKEFLAASGEHQVDEERRLAYVAFTRARAELLLAGSWWRDATRPRTPSPFLVELAEAGIVSDADWATMPAKDETNPRDELVHEADWPRGEPAAGRSEAAGAAAGDSTEAVLPSTEPRARAVVRAAASRVRERIDARASIVADEGPGAGPSALQEGRSPLLDPSGTDLRELARILLEERDRRDARSSEITFPAHISASGLVRLAADRDEYALHLRRPVPAQPTVHARRGTQFHLWAEQYFTSSSLLDVDDLPGADDEDISPDLDLDALQQTFLASEWAGRTPIAVEVDVETPVGGIMFRSRIDAVFPESPEHAGGARDAVVVVDWKTGKAPRDAEARRTREVQLAVYRLAWSRWSGLPVEKVNAAFYYLGSDETVRPERLLDAAELEALVAGRGT
ncbi:UvrD-helicase domain-containing protein [Oerskovia merdavium]|uniref:DNA 3'-5' helicase n=1 Tax=Oerskovia merdavium TaxID=2762227 RepID=A0ABR8TYA2_9CELL|nr:ATP-dependent DNA helicase [Oerskovia merdavium]MBD7980771.1 ATP-dependent helicase [Oerskovia merdavium]